MCKLGREKMINDECSLKKKRIEIVIMAERLYKSVNICLIAVSLGSSTNCHSEEPGGGGLVYPHTSSDASQTFFLST